MKKPVYMAICIALTASPGWTQDTFTSGVTISDADNATADLFVNDKTTLDGNVCIGSGCATNETYSDELVKLKQSNANMLFVDTSSEAGTFPSGDWRIRINDNYSNGADYFAIQDVDAATTPFKVKGGGDESTLVVSDGGEVGINTAFPDAELHIKAPAIADIRMDAGTAFWTLRAGGSYFALRDSNSNSSPFLVENDAPSSTLRLTATGDIGMGTILPDAPVHISRIIEGEMADTGMLHVQNTSTTTAQRDMMVFENNGDMEFLFNNTDPLAPTPTWKFITRQGDFRIVTPTTPGPEFQISNTGDLTISGTITTNGSCSVGCDAVFDPSYDLLSIEEHQATIRKNGYLPNVGPTRGDEPWDMTDKMGRMLNELEHAHLYIGQLHAQNAAQEARLADQEAHILALTSRLDKIEAN